MIGIYKITNKINNKVYIGQSVHIERRWAEHCQDSSNSVIAKAIKKYGKENFTFEVLEEYSEEDISKLDERENYFILLYNSIVPNGYNVTEYTGVQHTTFVTLSKEDFYKIVDLLQNTDKTFKEIADIFSVNRRTITRINNGETHKMINLQYPIRPSSHGISPKFKKLYNQKKEDSQNFCIDCGKKINAKATRCISCQALLTRKVERPSREELKSMIRTMTFVDIGKKYGVRDNSIRKWCISMNLPSKKCDINKYTNEDWEFV